MIGRSVLLTGVLITGDSAENQNSCDCDLLNVGADDCSDCGD